MSGKWSSHLCVISGEFEYLDNLILRRTNNKAAVRIIGRVPPQFWLQVTGRACNGKQKLDGVSASYSNWIFFWVLIKHLYLGNLWSTFGLNGCVILIWGWQIDRWSLEELSLVGWSDESVRGRMFNWQDIWAIIGVGNSINYSSILSFSVSGKWKLNC